MSNEMTPFEQIRRVNPAGNDFGVGDHFVDITDMVELGRRDDR